MEQELEKQSNFIQHFDGKDAIESFTRYQCALIEDGKIDPLQYRVRVQALRKALDNIDSQIKDNVMSEARKYAGEGKKFEAFGAKIEFTETGVSYDYAASNDPEWNQLDADIKALTEKKKARETLLKALKSPVTIVDEGTGETTQVHPPIKKGTEFIKISF